jgi:NtrC-family two-component system sensor histidine kinase KinB
MKIKTKLTLGVGLLFILIILLSLVGTGNINALKGDTENILVANYNTLEYSRNMLLALEEGSNIDIQKFENYLQNQEKNITEMGENDATFEVRNNFETYKKNPFRQQCPRRNS